MNTVSGDAYNWLIYCCKLIKKYHMILKPCFREGGEVRKDRLFLKGHYSVKLLSLLFVFEDILIFVKAIKIN